MSIITRRQERERLVLDLYNQGNTIREIAKQARMSFRDIGVILNKVVEEKEKGNELKQDFEKNKQQKEEQQQLSLSTQAYKLFCEGKTTLEVAIELNLEESEATEFCRGYWKLKQLHNLNIVYEEINDDIAPFLKLYKLAKRQGMGVQQVVDALAIANNNLPEIEWRYERLQREVAALEFKKQQSRPALSYFKSQMEKQNQALNSLHISCETERIEIENLYNEKARLEALITEFKSNNEDYLKIKEAAEMNVISVLTNGKLLLQFAIASAIESLRRNPELCNFIIYDISNNATISYGSDYPSLVLSGRQYQQSFNDTYTALLLEEAEKLYNELTTKLTNEIIASTATMKTTTSSLPLQLPSSDDNSQNLNYEKDNTYQTEETRCNNNNQPQI